MKFRFSEENPRCFRCKKPTLESDYCTCLFRGELDCHNHTPLCQDCGKFMATMKKLGRCEIK